MEKKYVIGVDVGGQSAKCGIVDARGEVLAQTVIKSNTQTEASAFINDLAAALKGIIASAGVEGQVMGIGVGAPDANYYTGVIEHAVNLTWSSDKPIEFSKMLSEAMGGIPVALTNDDNSSQTRKNSSTSI